QQKLSWMEFQIEQDIGLSRTPLQLLEVDCLYIAPLRQAEHRSFLFGKPCLLLLRFFITFGGKRFLESEVEVPADALDQGIRDDRAAEMMHEEQQQKDAADGQQHGDCCRQMVKAFPLARILDRTQRQDEVDDRGKEEAQHELRALVRHEIANEAGPHV